MNGPERRACRRFLVPGAVVDWRTVPPGAAYGSDAHVGDLSLGGMRLLTAGPPWRDAVLELSLRVPGEPALALRGRVAWSAPSSGQIHGVGVEFAPYGDAAGLNPPSVLDRLAEIEARFSRSPLTRDGS